MRVRPRRRLVGLLTLLLLVAIAVELTGFEVSLPRFGAADAQHPPLPGVRVLAASVVLRVGAGAPAGGELAFLAVEPNGNLLVSDSRRHAVLRFDPTGHLLSEWGPRLGDATLGEPAGVAVQGDSFYVLDRGTPRIFRLDASGRVQAVLDLRSSGTYGLNGLAVDLAGNLYAADTGRNRILVVGQDGSLLRSVGHGGADQAGFTQPMSVSFAPDASFFVADWENSRIAHWSATFEALEAWSTSFRPFGVAVDSLGRVFVPDFEHRRVEAYSADGALLGDLGSPGTPPIDVAPKQVAVGRGGQLAVYALGSDGIERLDLENTTPPPQASGDVDLLSLGVLVLLGVVVALAVVSRRARRRAALAGAASGGPIRLDAENGTQRQHEQAGANQDLLIADQTKREQEPAR